MKFLNNIFILVLSLIFISSCQKELDFEAAGPSTGSLKSDSTFDCLPNTVSGVYKADSILGSGNYIDVQVEIINPGSYNIQSDTINGYSFQGVGNLGAPGLNSVRLYGTGTPFLPGINTFMIRFDSSFCFVDVEVGGVAPTAQYTFGGNGGACTGTPVLAGTYMATLPTSAANTVTLDVTVDSIGSYSITSDTLNGVTFTGTGNFSSTAPPQTVQLTASGTPLVADTFNFTVSGSGSTCSFTVIFDTAAPPAVFTLGGAPGNCTAVSLSGTYQVGTAIGSGNTVSIEVTVTTPGLYSITTNAQNGVTFSTGTALFTTATTQTVVLTASGTVVADGTFTYTITAGGSSCTFTVVFTPAPVNTITCKIDNVFTTFNDNATASLANIGGETDLTIVGKTSASGIPEMLLNLKDLSGGNIVPGTYTVNQFATGFYVGGDYTDSTSAHWQAAPDITGGTQNPAFTLVITSINLTTNRVVGTFTGPLKDNGGIGPGFKTITEGQFDVPIQ